MSLRADRRILLVHAHPDDESITTGATMAAYAATGVHVTLVTCTRGEQGEIIPPDLAHLAADSDDTLGTHREGELADAITALGVPDHRFLGEEGHGLPVLAYRDSGMAIDPDGSVVRDPAVRADAFVLAALDEAAERVAAVVREVRPHVVVTYDPRGGYGHPDHVQTHLVTMRAVELAAADGPGGQGWSTPKVYWVVSPDAEATAVIDVPEFLPAKIAALRAHATQISLQDGTFALSNGIAQPLVATEFYRLVRGSPGGPLDEQERETDLFGGCLEVEVTERS